ncbi:hypothetical protein GCM10007242_48980 [Pigmentiphaga litoralis]|jgi:hypothetical protein|uniref:hypothetical protein n=1 Tax=Pigmentiphaga litoralis TaxID=516702 RepID=UPI00167B7FBC|nr:hypothetical protein [Pigmentiphaga litoralis]GGX35958.1 hypothetical protein GCM10007242_48980 [Pigmentiphaga litoralis]
MTDNASQGTPNSNDVKDTADDTLARSGSQGKGVHAPKEGEQIVSRSADPGQSSYGGFSGEDTTKQTQEVEADAEKSATSKGDTARSAVGKKD